MHKEATYITCKQVHNWALSCFQFGFFYRLEVNNLKTKIFQGFCSQNVGSFVSMVFAIINYWANSDISCLASQSSPSCKPFPECASQAKMFQLLPQQSLCKASCSVKTSTVRELGKSWNRKQQLQQSIIIYAVHSIFGQIDKTRNNHKLVWSSNYVICNVCGTCWYSVFVAAALF